MVFFFGYVLSSHSDHSATAWRVPCNLTHSHLSLSLGYRLIAIWPWASRSKRLRLEQPGPQSLPMFRGPRVLDIYGMVYLQYNFEQGVRPRYGMIQYAVPPLVWNAGPHSTEAGSHTPRWQESDSDSSNNQARLQLGRGTPTRALVTRRWQLQSTERVRLLDSYVLFPTREPNSDTGGAAWNIAGCNLTLRYDYMQIGALIAHTTPKIA